MTEEFAQNHGPHPLVKLRVVAASHSRTVQTLNHTSLAMIENAASATRLTGGESWASLGVNSIAKLV